MIKKTKTKQAYIKLLSSRVSGILSLKLLHHYYGTMKTMKQLPTISLNHPKIHFPFVVWQKSLGELVTVWSPNNNNLGQISDTMLLIH